MSYLLDTNVISELRKGQVRCHPQVFAWAKPLDDEELYTSVLVMGEIRKGIEKARPRDVAWAEQLENWLWALEIRYGERVIGIDPVIADEWGRISALRTVPVIDGLLAATARVRGLTLVTRNVADVADLGAALLDPFATAS